MSKKQVDESVLAALANVDDVSLHHQYSGRGMFGEACFGFSSGHIPCVIGQVIEELIEDHLDALESFAQMLTESSSDSMGSGRTILYFPGWESGIEEPEEEEEE